MQAVRTISNYLSSSCKWMTMEDRSDLIQDMLCRYHSYRATEEAKTHCIEQIIYNLFFLLPHVLSSKGIPADCFDDAIQNMVVNIIKAIDKYDIYRGTKFTSYLVGYFKDALSTTFRDTHVVRAPAYIPYNTPVPLSHSSDTSTLDDVNGAIPLQNKADALCPKSSEDNVLNKELINFLEFSLSSEAGALNEKEIFVVTYRYGVFGAPTLTFDTIAKMFGSYGWSGTKVWVFQIQQSALKKLRKFFAINRVTL